MSAAALSDYITDRATTRQMHWGRNSGSLDAVEIAAVGFDPRIERERRVLATLLLQLATDGVSWSEREPTKIGPLSAVTAMRLIMQLPGDRAFPQVAPDGDEGVMLVWDSGGRRVLVIVDQSTLFPVVDPGRDTSRHLEPMRYDGESLPLSLVDQLPSRS